MLQTIVRQRNCRSQVTPCDSQLRTARRARVRRWVLRSVLGANSLEKVRHSVHPSRTFGLCESDFPIEIPPQRHIVSGAIHAHSTYSDGCGTVPEIIAAGKKAGLQFVVLSDHETLQPLRDGWQRYWDDLLVLVGAEIRTDAGYLLALGLPDDFRSPGTASDALLDAVERAGGLAFAVHPAHPYLDWKNWTHPALAGLEVLNLHSLSRHAASLTSLARFGALIRCGRGDAALRLLSLRPTRELGMWDSLLASGRSVGLASSDAHGHVKVGGRRVHVPGYADSFRMVQTHLVLRSPLSGDASQDRVTVLEALRRGACRLAFPLSGDPSDLQFYYSDGRRWLTEGDEALWSPMGRIYVRTSQPSALFRLYRDGKMVARAEGQAFVFRCEGPGVYRLEADRVRLRLPGFRSVRPWLFTNPIYLR